MTTLELVLLESHENGLVSFRVGGGPGAARCFDGDAWLCVWEWLEADQ